MIGHLRLALALMVALSHIPDSRQPINLGVIAVVFFYFLSGALMAMSYARFRQHSRRPVLAFWLDRALRLWPSFATILVVVIAAAAISGKPMFGTPLDLSPRTILSHFALVDMNRRMVYLDPPAWSLGSETQFYILTPLLLALPVRWVSAIALASLGFQIYSGYFMDIRPAEFWSYHTPAGTLHIFCLGICWARREQRGYRRLLGAIIGIQAIAMLVLYPIFRPFDHLWVMEIWIGVMTVTPIAGWVFSRPETDWDTWLGSWSYPLFLSHFPAMYLADILEAGTPSSPGWIVASMSLCLCLAALLRRLIERPAEKVRLWSRGFSSLRRERAIR